MNVFYTKGFTLIELMITVAIIGIIATVAYPSYTEYVKRSHRAEVRSMLLENTQFLERNYTTANRYDQTSGGATINTAALPRRQSPASGAARYTIELDTGTAPAQTFIVRAIPTGTMSGDSCGTLTLTNTGARGSGGNIATCWDAK